MFIFTIDRKMGSIVNWLRRKVRRGRAGVRARGCRRRRGEGGRAASAAHLPARARPSRQSRSVRGLVCTPRRRRPAAASAATTPPPPQSPPSPRGMCPWPRPYRPYRLHHDPRIKNKWVPPVPGARCTPWPSRVRTTRIVITAVFTFAKLFEFS